MRAHELIAWMADQHGARYQIERPAAMAIAERAAAHKSDCMPVVYLDERPIGRTGGAKTIDDADGSALQGNRGQHGGQATRSSRTSADPSRATGTSSRRSDTGASARRTSAAPWA